jgi:two-component system, NtrC family, sensor kinase
MLLEAESTGLPDAIRNDLEVLHRNAGRVARIAQGLLSFSRHSPETYAAVQLNDVVRETLLLAEHQVTRTGVSLRVDAEDPLPPIRGDGNALEQVLLNLITNAGAAVEAGGEVRIATRRHPDRPGFVQLIVADTGCGIPPDILPHIFDPFFSTKPSGTGLGLSISHGIVREHGGTIDVESTPGQGTRFSLTLPVIERPA